MPDLGILRMRMSIYDSSELKLIKFCVKKRNLTSFQMMVSYVNIVVVI